MCKFMRHSSETAAYADYSRTIACTDIGYDAFVDVVLENDPVANERDDPLSDSAVISLVFFKILVES